MTLHDVIVIIAAGLNFVAFGGFAWWIAGWICSLRDAVDAQGETIKAQKNLLEDLRTVLEATDTPKMFEGWEAYKKIVDHEKETWEQSFKRQWNEEKQKSSRAMDIIAAFMPYVPSEQRKKTVERIDFDDQIKGILLRLVDQAPDIPLSQEATSELVRVIVSSPTDILAVFELIVKNAARLCDAPHSTIHRVYRNVMRRVASLEQFSSAPVGEEIPLTRDRTDRIPALAIIDRKTIHAIDKDVPVYIELPKDSHIMIGVHGIKAMVATPLLRESKEAIGCIVVGRDDYRPFTAAQIVLLEILADQAVIAMEPRFREGRG